MTLNERLSDHPPSLSLEMLSPSAVLSQAKQLVLKGKQAVGNVDRVQGKKLFSALRLRERQDFTGAGAVNQRERHWGNSQS